MRERSDRHRPEDATPRGALVLTGPDGEAPEKLE